MKLFKSLLVAPATLGLLAPLSATANEINLTDVSNYSSSEEVENISEFNPAKELAVTNSRVDGIEARLNNFEAGSFSSTTSASFGVDFMVGSVDGNTTTEKTTANYSYGIGLTTSFTGEDSLDVTIDAGNAISGANEGDLNGSGDTLVVDGITYTFPIGEDLTVLVGDSTSGSALYSTACVYGGFTNTLDDCGNGNSAFGTNSDNSVGFSASYDIGNGFTGAIGYVGSGAGTKGIATDESLDYFGGQLAYAADSYGLSATFSTNEDGTDSEVKYLAFNGYWTPAETGLVPSISLGYETGSVSDETGGNVLSGTGAIASRRDTYQWFMGLQWDEMGPGTLGAAIGTAGAIAEDSDLLTMWEVFYSYPVNDSMTITPAAYVKETAGTADDETGIMVKTSFSF